MDDKTLQSMNLALTSKRAILAGLTERAEQLSKQLETALNQIDEINQEIDAINELQSDSSDDPETQDSPHNTPSLFSKDLEPANHQEDT